jgi:hypothetical protein
MLLSAFKLKRTHNKPDNDYACGLGLKNEVRTGVNYEQGVKDRHTL